MYKINLLLISVVLFFASCTKDQSSLLDPATTGITDKDVFKSALYADQYLTDIYGFLVPVLATTGNNGSRWRGIDGLLEITTDNGSSNLASPAAFRTFNSGGYSAATGGMFYQADWITSYQAIRACNLYLSHIDEVPLDTEYGFDEPVRANRKAEATFLKAWNYAELCKEFGGVPILDTVFAITDDMSVARSTYDETVKYITDLCDRAAATLPLEYPDGQLGRVTRGAALALKARTLLYAASPLWNNSAKPDDSPFRGKYDATKWRKAAEAAAVVINMNQYSLYSDLSSLFTTRTNPEIIFAHMQVPEAYQTQLSVPFRLYPAGAGAKSGCNQVTYNMIKEYEIIKNGIAYSITDPASGYNPNDPYKNLDPRFYRDCIFNGAKFQGKTVSVGEAESGAAGPIHNNAEISPYYTYVYNTKFADLTIVINVEAKNPAYGQTTNQNYPYIRYAEILLDYAEAMNEAFGPEVDGLANGKTALWAVNQVRTRAAYQAGKQEYMGYTGSMPAIASGLSKDQLRDKIRHERRVELTFEEHRFWDIRRWKVAPDEEIVGQIPVYKLGGGVEYQLRTIEIRPFDTRTFRMPIPENELFTNPKLVQNPGWNMSPEASE